MKVQVKAIREHQRGKIYDVTANGKKVSILITFHALERISRWRLTDRKVLQALLFPEEVVRGHRIRYIAHRRSRGHVLRAVYEYERNMPVVITVYYPAAERYFKGGGVYEDKILS
jgi:hypothetical protein